MSEVKIKYQVINYDNSGLSAYAYSIAERTKLKPVSIEHIINHFKKTYILLLLLYQN